MLPKTDFFNVMASGGLYSIVSKLGTNTSDPSHEGMAGSTTCTIGMYRESIAGALVTL